MRPWLLDSLICPTCSTGAIVVIRKDETHSLATPAGADEILVSGILGCAACAARYPVLDESPRLLAPDLMTPAEKDCLARPAPPARHGGPAVQRSDAEIKDLVARRIMTDYGNPTEGPGLRRARDDISYQHAYEDKRIYQLQLIRRLLSRRPELVVDVGGGRGGNLRAARRAFEFGHGVAVDLDSEWPPLYRTGARDLVYIRADATRLPLKTRCADLTISSFLLEHVRAWEALVLEIRRVSRFAFLAFGPNRAFPYEFGHVDAVLAHTLPPRLGAGAAYLWDRVSGNRRSYARLRQILGGMNYITSRRYFAFCRARGLEVQNVFVDVLDAWARAGGSGRRARLAKHPALLRFLAGTVAASGLEPNVYSIMR
jgi:uncharacterized protein YbaR (Trm112 family)/SAM-dependent methyltransferase